MAAVGLVWDIQAVPERIYAEARANRTRRSAVAPHGDEDRVPIALDLAEETD
jgi:hypothetical protein